MDNKENKKFYKLRNLIIIVLIAVSILFSVFAIKIYGIAVLGVNTAANEDSLTRLVAALVKAQNSDRSVSRSEVETKLYTYIASVSATVTEDDSLDAIVVTYTDSGRSYYIKRNSMYTITFNANGGTGGPSTQTKRHGQSIVLSTDIPTRANHDFLGWSTNASASTGTYGAGVTYTGNGNVTLYAIWQPLTYTVAYNANGGSGSVSPVTQNIGTNMMLKASNIFTAPSGYHFSSWNTASGGTGTSYAAGATYSAQVDATMYAIWGAHTDSCWHRTYHTHTGSQEDGGGCYTIETTSPAGFFNDEGWEGDYYRAYLCCAGCGDRVKMYWESYTNPTTGEVTVLVDDGGHPATHCYIDEYDLGCGFTEGGIESQTLICGGTQ